MKFILSSLLMLALSSFAFAEESETTETLSAEEAQYMQWAQGVWESLNRQHGEITIEQAGAKLNVPESFYFLDGKDANTVLVDVWGNPPGGDVLGMLMPEGTTPFDNDSWAVTIAYEEDGYVSDEDAKDIDYADLLKDMQADTAESNTYRQQNGYPTVELVGWASQPFYDANTNKLHWAKEIRFGDSEVNTLNYNIRVLGRKGVLVLNFIAGMDQKQLIESQMDTVLSIANFQEGAQYADFNPEMDKVAAYGLGALVAGKVLAKTGFLAIALVFLKKFGIFILLGLGWVFKSLFSRKKAVAQENDTQA